VLSLRLTEFDLTPTQVGLFFAVPSLSFLVHTPFISLYTKWVPKRGVILIGFAVLALGMFFIGSSPLLKVPEEIMFVVIGLMMEGAGLAMTIVPIFPEMLESVEERYPQYLGGAELSNVSAGMFNSALGVGEAIGPVVSSLLNSRIGFRGSQDVLGLIVSGFCVIYFFMCGGPYMFALRGGAGVAADDTLNGDYEDLKNNVNACNRDENETRVDDGPRENNLG